MTDCSKIKPNMRIVKVFCHRSNVILHVHIALRTVVGSFKCQLMFPATPRRLKRWRGCETVHVE